MERIVRKFDDFINEELNIERVSDTECYLTRPWYYYNAEDDIVYGSDTEPSSSLPMVFENNHEDDDIRLLSLDLDKLSLSVYGGQKGVMDYLNSIGYTGETLDDVDEIQNLFDFDENSRHMLVVGKRLLASSFDIIEEN